MQSMKREGQVPRDAQSMAIIRRCVHCHFIFFSGGPIRLLPSIESEKKIEHDMPENETTSDSVYQ